LLAFAGFPQGEVFVDVGVDSANVELGKPFEVRAEMDVPPGWHVYHPEQDRANGIPVSIAVDGADAIGPVSCDTQPKVHRDQIGGHVSETLWVFGSPEFTLPVVVEGPIGFRTIEVEVRWQLCDESVCLPPESKFFSIDLDVLPSASGAEASESFEVKVAAPSVQSATEELQSLSLLAFLLLAVGGGLFALAMPCTYPMIPITISFFTKQAEKRGGSVLPLSLAYGGGIIGIFILIGVAVGPLILAFATHPVTNLVIGILFLVFAFVLFGVLTLNPPRFLMTAAGRANAQGGYFGVFLMGATLVVTSFTCTAPFVGNILALAATGGGLARAALGMGVFGLTMAIPFVFLSLAPGRIQRLPQSGQWMDTLKVTLGFIELAAALKFISNADVVLGWKALSRETFLFLWAAIMLATAFYLFGFFRGRSKEPRPGRLQTTSAVMFLGFAGYCGYGWSGQPMDFVMTAIIPNYSNSSELAAQHEIVVDDYEAARAKALRQEKYLLVNFTGHT